MFLAKMSWDCTEGLEGKEKLQKKNIRWMKNEAEISVLWPHPWPYTAGEETSACHARARG